MNTFKWALGVAAAALFSTANAADRDNFSVAHYEPLQRLELRAVSARAANAMQPGSAESTVMSFDALGRRFDLQLEYNNRFMTAARQNPLLDSVDIYRGEIAGIEDSWVRIVMADGVPSGMFFDGQEYYSIEAPGDSAVDTDVPIVYKLSDVYVAPGSMSCGGGTLNASAATAAEMLVGELNAISQAPGAVSELEMGAVGDFEFTNSRGGDAAAAQAITTRLNNVDGIFSAQVGVQISVQVIDTFTTDTDPFTANEPSDLLNELSDYRLATPSQLANGLTHLYTGRDLNGTTVGIAWTGALCSARFGTGLSQGNGGPGFDSLVAAHEIGHNFGAPHDGEAESACESQAGDWLMSPQLNGEDQFSPCSLAEMADDIATASDNRFGNACIAPLPTVDTVVGLQSSAAILFGADSTLSYEVVNNGTLDASNVSLDIAIPSNLTVVAATAASGTCTAGAGDVGCTLGDIPGLGVRAVDVTVTPNALGAGMISATVFADNDDRLDNNQESLLLTVDPAVDLVVNAPAGSSVRVGNSTTVTATLENRATIGATGVSLTIDLGSSLRPTSASWPLGACSTQGQRVTCQAAAFAAQSNSTVSVTASGISEGSPRVTMSLASAEAELDPGNNSGSVRVEVRAASDDSGGSTGPLFLLLLGAVAALRRRS